MFSLWWHTAYYTQLTGNTFKIKNIDLRREPEPANCTKLFLLQTVQCRWHFQHWSHFSDRTTPKMSNETACTTRWCGFMNQKHTTQEIYQQAETTSSALSPQEVDARHNLTFRKLHLLLNGLLLLQVQQEESFPFTSMFGFLSADSPSTHSELEKHTTTINTIHTVPARPKKI